MISITKEPEISFSHNRPGLPLIEFVFVIFACLFYVSTDAISSYAFYMTIAFTGYVLYCFIKERSYRRLIAGFLAMLVVFSVLYLLLTDTLSISEFASNRELKRFYSKYGQFLIMFAPLFLFYRTATLATLNQIYISVIIVLLGLFLWSQVALTAVANNPEILHTFQQDAVDETGLTIAAFYYIYAFTFLLLTGWMCFKYANNTIIRYTALAIAFFSLYLLYKTQFALSVITVFFSIIFLYLATTRESGKKFIVVITALIVLFLMPVLIKGIISVSSSRIINVRLMEIYDLITGEDTTSGTDAQGRLDLYWMCIKAFFSSPIIGNRTLPLDGHATFLTIPADIGIYGVIFLYTFFKKSYSITCSVLGSKSIYFKPLLFQIIIMGFTNPIHSSPTIYILLFFVCPLVILLFFDERRVNPKTERRSY